MYNGYLIKIIGSGQAGDYVVPLTLMNQGTFKGTLSTLDKEGYRDGNMVLHRTAVSRVPHCSFETRPFLTNTQIQELWSNLQERYKNVKEKKVTASIYIDETDSYYQGDFYIPDVEMTIDHIEKDKIIYNAITFEFIGYGKKEDAS